MSRAVIITGGEILNKTAFNPREGDIYICADSGICNAAVLGIKPDVVIGDFDSYDGDFPDNINVIVHPPEKDETDTALAAEYAIGRGYKTIEIWGGTGGRLDHTMANILLLYSLYKKGVKAVLRDGINTAEVTDNAVSIKKGSAKYVSVFSLADISEGVTILGAKYPLKNYTLKQGDSLGVSNEVVDDKMDITLKSGMLLVITSGE